MKIHVLHHVHLPIKHGISTYLDDSPHEINHIYVFEEHTYPDIENIDWLIIMGGPMSANDETEHSYLITEKVFIKRVIDAGKTVLGICLGAQLIASALGAAVKQNSVSEFGWHTISPSADIKHTVLADIFNQDSLLFHSHSETFDIPNKAIKIASSEACENQGFIYDNRVIALQFHPEITLPLAILFDDACHNFWQKSPYYNAPQSSLHANELFNSSARLIKTLMQTIEASII
jgi:GMP synthase-like glutamine amidotransferase